MVLIDPDPRSVTCPRAYMIGDRVHDIAGGRANGTRTIGVLCGYGLEEEIRNARPELVVDSMPVLLAALASKTNIER